MKDDSTRLRHMLDAIEKINLFLSGVSNQDDFIKDEKTLSAVERQFEILGEASRQLSEEFQEQYPEVEWKKIQGLRNLLAHEYFGINTKILWDSYQADLPELKKFLERIL